MCIRDRVEASKSVKNLGLRVRPRYARCFSPGTRDTVRVTCLNIPQRTRWIFLSPNPREPACLPSDATMTPRALLRNDRRVVSSVLIATLRGASGRTNPERPVPFLTNGSNTREGGGGEHGNGAVDALHESCIMRAEGSDRLREDPSSSIVVFHSRKRDAARRLRLTRRTLHSLLRSSAGALILVCGVRR